MTQDKVLNNFSEQCPYLKAEGMYVTRIETLLSALARVDEEITLVVAVDDGLRRGAGQRDEIY